MDDETNSKRDRSKDITDEQPVNKAKKNVSFHPSGSGSEEENDSDGDIGFHEMSETVKTNTKVLHSTLRDEDPQVSQQEDRHAFSIPETPNATKFITRYNSENAQMGGPSNRQKKNCLNQSMRPVTDFNMDRQKKHEIYPSKQRRCQYKKYN